MLHPRRDQRRAVADSGDDLGAGLVQQADEAFADAVGRVAAGGSALDPEVVGRMLGRRRGSGPLDQLSPREREVLGAVAEGKSNKGIAEALYISEAAVEKHVTHIFGKLGLNQSAYEHRRVLAAVTYLRAGHP